MNTNSGTRGFEDYRLQRKRMQAKLGLPQNSLGYENNALKELEEVEAREVRDQQLSREVHDFFSAATKQAAAIVEKVARDAQSEIGQRIQDEMESFLRDALQRVTGLVGALMHRQQRQPGVAQADVEPKIGNLGSGLDAFRWEGTAEGADKHIGQDPFDIDVDDVRKEFREQLGVADAAATAEKAPMSIDEHLVADLEDEAPATPAETPPPAPKATATTKAAPAPKAPPTARAGAQPPAEFDPSPTPEQELERFKGALKALVRQGTMTREEARAAWQTRLASLGLK